MGVGGGGWEACFFDLFSKTDIHKNLQGDRFIRVIKGTFTEFRGINWWPNCLNQCHQQ